MVEEDRDAGGVDEASCRVGGQRNLAVPSLGRQTTLDDRELPLGGRPGRLPRQRDVPAQAMVA